jgi:hypothetical protein
MYTGRQHQQKESLWNDEESFNFSPPLQQAYGSIPATLVLPC